MDITDLVTAARVTARGRAAYDLAVSDGVRTIRLQGVPARVFLASQDHQHDLVRELTLIDFGDRFDLAAADVSVRLGRLISDILSRYRTVRSVTRRQAIAAVERGDDVVDLDVPVEPGMADALRDWLALLEEADERCRDGELLLLASTPDVRELRRWYVEQLTRHLD